MAEVKDLSMGQESLWVLYRLAPDSAAYNDADATVFTPGLDLAMLDRSIAAVVRRHELLRSRFVEYDGQPVRVVCPPSLVRLEVVDLPDADDDRLRSEVVAAATRPLRLEADGPCRFVLLRRGTDDALVVVVHHIASDATSQRIIWRNLLAAYEAFEAGAEPDWPALTGTYDGFVARERALVSGQRGRELAAYWTTVCAGARAATLPTDRPRPAQPTYRGSAHRRSVPGQLAGQVRAAAAEAGVTDFAVLLGVFWVALHHHTRESDFTIGCPVTTRRTSGLRDVVGLLVNTTILRASFTAETTFASAMVAASRQLGELMTGAGYPFALVNKTRSGPDPLYRIAITMVRPQLGDSVPNDKYVVAGRQARRIPVPSLEGQCDLTVDVRLTSSGSMTLSFRYDVELFDEATIARFADHFLRLLSVACTNPDLPICRAPTADENERLTTVQSPRQHQEPIG